MEYNEDLQKHIDKWKEEFALFGSCVYCVDKKDNKIKGARYVVVEKINDNNILLQSFDWLTGQPGYMIIRPIEWFYDKIIQPYCEDQETADWYFDNRNKFCCLTND